MRKTVKAVRFTGIVLALALLALPGMAAMDHGSMKTEGTGGGHGDMMTMGDKVWSGKIGPWTGEARLMDMKAHMEAAKKSGMKMEGAMANTHHVALQVTDPKTKKPVTDARGTVTVTGPDKKQETTDFMFMEGHLGADVNLPKPGKYTFKADIESGGKKGTATFAHTIK